MFESRPEHLIIVGGGYIAIEFGQMFRRFGSEVTIIQHSQQLLTREDEDVAEEIQSMLEADGIRVFLNTAPTAVEKNQQSGVTLKANTPEGEITLSGSHLLVAAGRVPNSDRLNWSGVPAKARLKSHANWALVIKICHAGARNMARQTNQTIMVLSAENLTRLCR